MAVRHIYLKIERIFSYSTVEPELKEGYSDRPVEVQADDC